MMQDTLVLPRTLSETRDEMDLAVKLAELCSARSGQVWYRNRAARLRLHERELKRRDNF